MNTITVWTVHRQYKSLSRRYKYINGTNAWEPFFRRFKPLDYCLHFCLKCRFWQVYEKIQTLNTINFPRFFKGRCSDGRVAPIPRGECCPDPRLCRSTCQFPNQICRLGKKISESRIYTGFAKRCDCLRLLNGTLFLCRS